ncbi:MAG: hypothetical protein P8101_07770 [Candidatus Thiodiazotropha sp.]
MSIAKMFMFKNKQQNHYFKVAKRHLGFLQEQAATFTSQRNMGPRTYYVGCGELCEPHH